jgi:hypothetical protein
MHQCARYEYVTVFPKIGRPAEVKLRDNQWARRPRSAPHPQAIKIGPDNHDDKRGANCDPVVRRRRAIFS